MYKTALVSIFSRVESLLQSKYLNHPYLFLEFNKIYNYSVELPIKWGKLHNIAKRERY